MHRTVLFCLYCQKSQSFPFCSISRIPLILGFLDYFPFYIFLFSNHQIFLCLIIYPIFVYIFFYDPPQNMPEVNGYKN